MDLANTGTVFDAALLLRRPMIEALDNVKQPLVIDDLEAGIVLRKVDDFVGVGDGSGCFQGLKIRGTVYV